MLYLLNNPGDQLDTPCFEAAAGVGVQVTPEQIEEAVSIIWHSQLISVMDEIAPPGHYNLYLMNTS